MEKEDMDNIIAFNKDQAEHIRLVQTLIFKVVRELMDEAINHDATKWCKEEYETFVESRLALNNAKTGNEAGYQKTLMSDAVQHHYKYNSHHPEFWKDCPNKMPVVDIITMFFDWASRSVAKKESMDNFWDYNIKKLADFKQEHALPIVNALRKDYEEYIQRLIDYPSE